MTGETQGDVLRRIQKLLKLTSSDNVAEAAAAAAKAQELMDRYQLSADALAYSEDEAAVEEDIEIYGDEDPLDRSKGRQLRTWRWNLAYAIARSNTCKLYVTAYKDIAIVGRPGDVATCRYLFSWLRREVEKLACLECFGHGQTYSNNFRLGAVETISRKLYEQRMKFEAEVRADAARAENRNALVLVNNALAVRTKREYAVEKVFEDLSKARGFTKGKASRPNYDAAARQHGREAAETIAFRKSRGAIEG